MKTYGLEYAVLPILGLLYFRIASEFSWPAALANNAVLTAVCAAAAYWRSKQLAGPPIKYSTFRKPPVNNLDPVWPALMCLVLAFLGALQIILAVSHISYYRTGPLVPDMFDS